MYPLFGFGYETKGLYCFRHKFDNMINIGKDKYVRENKELSYGKSDSYTQYDNIQPNFDKEILDLSLDLYYDDDNDYLEALSELLIDDDDYM